jgi:HK97 family phage prohead protease
VTRADNPDKPYGDVTYADPGYQDDGKARYPLDTPDHIRSAWSYIHQADNANLYSGKHLKKIKDRIKDAGKDCGVQFEDHMDDPMPMGSRSTCCPDHLPGEAHVFRRDWTLDGIDIIRGAQGGDGRTVEAYATPFGVPTEVKDQHGHYMETIHPTAFDEALRGGFGAVKVFYNHGMNIHGQPSDLFSIPIGRAVDVRPDGKGLRTITRYNEGDVGDSILDAIRNKALTGYSFRGPIRQSDPPRIPRARDGQPLPAVTRTRLGLTEYGPTPMPYYTDASIIALRSKLQRLQTLDDDVFDRLVELLAAATPQDQEAAVRAITATPNEGPGTEDQPDEALRSASMASVRRKIATARILGRIT